jgi:hypothetical protein
MSLVGLGTKNDFADETSRNLLARPTDTERVSATIPLYTCIRKILVSILRQDTSYPDGAGGFPQFF